MKEIPTKYDPHSIEDRIYKQWVKENLFHADPSEDKDPYCIVIPPPNVTGELHLGHALVVAIEDLMIRKARMQGLAALWVPGTDHAGIATQLQVEKMIMSEE